MQRSEYKSKVVVLPPAIHSQTCLEAEGALWANGQGESYTIHWYLVFSHREEKDYRARLVPLWSFMGDSDKRETNSKTSEI